MATMIKFHNAVHGQPMSVIEGNDDMLVLKRGDKGIVVLNKSTRSQSLSLATDINWIDMMSGSKIPSNVELKVPAKSSMLLVPEA